MTGAHTTEQFPTETAGLPSCVDSALVEVSDLSVVVIRACYLALRRGAADELVKGASGIVVMEEAGRALGTREVADVLGVPVLATIPVRAAIARVIDAGVLVARLPETLARPTRTLLARLGVPNLRVRP